MRKDVLIAVTTTTRMGVDYLPDTIEALEKNGALMVAPDRRLIHADGGLSRSSPMYSGWQVLGTDECIGSRLSFWRVLQHAAKLDVDLLAFEDDIKLCKNAVAKMLDYEVPEMLAWVSFFDNMTEKPHAPGLKIYSLGHDNFWGVQAVKIPKRCYPYLLDESIDVVKHLPAGYLGGRDHAMQYRMAPSPWPFFGALFPNLVQHIGKVSALNGTRAQRYAAEGRERVSVNYPGEDFDALSI